MEVKKPKAQSTVVNGGRRSNRNAVDGEGSRRKSTEPIDHWGFLEEIDAPMWADLTLESLSIDKDIDDNWFQVAHPFHQMSTYHFISSSTVLGERETNPDTDLLEKSPPRLPRSVSKSRGKHYKSRKWRGGNADKQHPIRVLGSKTTRVTSVRPNVKTSFGIAKCASGSKGKLVCENNSTGTRRPNSIQSKLCFQNPKCTSSSNSTHTRKPTSNGMKPSSGDSENSSSVSASFTVKSSSTGIGGPDSLKHTVTLGDARISSTIRPHSPKIKPSTGDSENISSVNASSGGTNNSAAIHVSDSPKHKSSFGDSKSSTKSTVNMGTEGNSHESQIISDVSQQIFGRTSGFLSAVRLSLRKSCVTRLPSRVEVKDKRQSRGRKSSLSKSSVGSTTNDGYNFKNTATMKKSITPESRMDQSTNDNNVKGKSMSKPSSVGLLDYRPNFKPEGKTAAAKFVDQETSKSKFQGRKPLWMQNVQVLSSIGTKAKESVPNNKVKAFRRNLSSKKVGGKENDVWSMVWTQKASSNTSDMEDKALSGPKAKAIARNEKNNRKNVVKKTHFR